jgi:hypothetical protein
MINLIDFRLIYFHFHFLLFKKYLTQLKNII